MSRLFHICCYRIVDGKDVGVFQGCRISPRQRLHFVTPLLVEMRDDVFKKLSRTQVILSATPNQNDLGQLYIKWKNLPPPSAT
jgi:hypothetical protein